MLETMRLELKREGYDVQFVVVNKADAADYQAELTKRTSFAVLQDLDTVQAWTVHHQGNKDDFYVYDKDGKLFEYLPVSTDGPTSTWLSTPDGYAHVKGVVLAALKK